MSLPLRTTTITLAVALAALGTMPAYGQERDHRETMAGREQRPAPPPAMPRPAPMPQASAPHIPAPQAAAPQTPAPQTPAPQANAPRGGGGSGWTAPLPPTRPANTGSSPAWSNARPAPTGDGARNADRGQPVWRGTADAIVHEGHANPEGDRSGPARGGEGGDHRAGDGTRNWGNGGNARLPDRLRDERVRDDNRWGRGDNRPRWSDGRRDWRAWDDGWRGNRRYDWYAWRQLNRDVFRPAPYRPPYRGFAYVRIGIGLVLDDAFLDRAYWISDPWFYHLPPVWGPYRWVRYYNDCLLVDVDTGQVVDVIYNVFW